MEVEDVGRNAKDAVTKVKSLENEAKACQKVVLKRLSIQTTVSRNLRLKERPR